MNNYFQCPTCGSPSDSESKCSYCGNIFLDKSKLIISKSDKGQFDLAIYELKRGNYEKSLKKFDKIIEKDSSNKLAWLYKFTCELGVEKDLNEFVNKINLNKLNDICDSISEDILNAIRNSLLRGYEHNFNYVAIGRINHQEFLCFINKFKDSFKGSLIQIFSERYKEIKNEYQISDFLLNELEFLINNFDFFAIEKSITKEFIESLIDLSTGTLKYHLPLIRQHEESNFKRFKRYGGIKKENYFYKEYIKADFTPRIINKFRILNKFSELIDIDIDKHIEELQTIDSEINHIVNNSTKETANPVKKDACFIATAAMGDYNHPIVIELRQFRDEWLLKRAWGVNFTKWYYTHGSKAASIIEKSTILKKITFYAIIKPLQVITKNLR